MELRTATPDQVRAGFWDTCPYCQHPVYMPIAGGKESKAPVRCPKCSAALKPEC